MNYNALIYNELKSIKNKLGKSYPWVLHFYILFGIGLAEVYFKEIKGKIEINSWGELWELLIFLATYPAFIGNYIGNLIF